MGGVRWAWVMLVLAAVVVAVGTLGTGVRVVDAIDQREIRYGGTLDATALRAAANADSAVPAGWAQLAEASGVEAIPVDDAGVLAVWATVELVPWLLGATTLVLLASLLRAAGRGAPVLAVAARRLRALGLLLIIALPAVPFARWSIAEQAQDGVTFATPSVDLLFPLPLWELLPGALLLVLAAVLQRAALLDRQPA